MKERGLVAIIIVTWNNSKDISNCLTSLLEQSYKKFQIVVVDNNSEDNTVTIVEENFPAVDLIHLQKNLYYAGGNNYGFRYALKKYSPNFVLVLNPDTIASIDLLETLLKEMDNREIAAVGPKILFKGGKLDGKINSAGLFYDGLHSAYDVGFGEEDKGQYDQTKEIFAVTGTCILFRAEFITRTGGFWEVLKMYIEEVELFIRAKKMGFKVIYTGKTSVQHKYMQSTLQVKDWNLEKHKMRNWLLIALRHYSLRDKLRMLRDYVKFTFY